MKEGYILIATNQQKFLELALNLALSIKLKDNKKRPIALLYDNRINIPEKYKKYFDILIKKNKEDNEIYGTTNKILLFKYSPFERTMYIDSDCLMVKKDISIIWKKLRRYNFTVMGHKVIAGTCGCWNLNIKEVIKKLHLSYMIHFNGGVIYFDKSELSLNVFKKIKEYYKNAIDVLGCRFRGTYNDEPFICVAMGYFCLKPFPMVFRHYWKIIQWHQFVVGEYNEINPFKETFYIDCGKGHLEHPTLAHFQSLGNDPKKKMLKVYTIGVNKLRKYYNLPLFNAEILGRKYS